MKYQVEEYRHMQFSRQINLKIGVIIWARIMEQDDIKIEGFSDAHWAGSLDTRRWTSM